MKMKLIVAMVGSDRTATVVEAARAGGATGATVLTSGRGEGLRPRKTFLGLEVTASRDLLLLLVAGGRSRDILERIRDAGRFDDDPGSGIAFQIDIEDAVGLSTQLPVILEGTEEDM